MPDPYLLLFAISYYFTYSPISFLFKLFSGLQYESTGLLPLASLNGP